MTAQAEATYVTSVTKLVLSNLGIFNQITVNTYRVPTDCETGGFFIKGIRLRTMVKGYRLNTSPRRQFFTLDRKKSTRHIPAR